MMILRGRDARGLGAPPARVRDRPTRARRCQGIRGSQAGPKESEGASRILRSRAFRIAPRAQSFRHPRGVPHHLPSPDAHPAPPPARSDRTGPRRHQAQRGDGARDQRLRRGTRRGGAQARHGPQVRRRAIAGQPGRAQGHQELLVPRALLVQADERRRVAGLRRGGRWCDARASRPPGRPSPSRSRDGGHRG